MSSKRENLPEVKVLGDSNVGLLLDRFVDVDATSSQETLLQIVSQKNETYELAYKRWCDGLNTGNTAVSMQPLKVQGRLVSGLGIATPLETGLSLHHTYGVPWLPGSGLKGLAAHYCKQVWGAEDSNFLERGDAYKIMFGTQEQAGALVFHDGWWIPDSKSPFKLDVITVHHQDYYGGNASKPTDFDTPVPVQFLSINGSFKIAVQCIFDAESELEQAKAKDWAVLGLNLLQDALANWGFGGKTNAGYGRLVSDEYAASMNAKREAAQKEAALAQKKKAAAEAAEKQKAELSATPFKKVGDFALASVVADGGTIVTVKGIVTVEGKLQELQCKKFASAKAGNTVKIKAIEWPKKKTFPTMCEIVEVLQVL